MMSDETTAETSASVRSRTFALGDKTAEFEEGPAGGCGAASGVSGLMPPFSD